MATHSLVPSIVGSRSTASSWCTTELCESKIYFNWKIKNFPLCRHRNGEVLESSTFAAPNNKSEWRLHMYPNGAKQFEGYVSLYLSLVSGSNVKAQFKIFLYNKDMESKNEETGNFPLSGNNSSGFPEFIKRDYLLNEENGLLSGSDLNIGCEVYIRESAVVKSTVCDPKPLGVVECGLSRNLGDLLQSQRYCDFILRVNGRKFNCHKAILAARSPVFAAMFEHEMRERNRNEAFITDVDEDTMEAFLQYIYTGKVEVIDKFAPDLLALSDKYDVPNLKLVCEEHLLSVLSTDTAVDMLLLADKYRAEKLKKFAIMYFVCNATAVRNTLKWESISTRRPGLLKELIDALTAD